MADGLDLLLIHRARLASRDRGEECRSLTLASLPLISAMLSYEP